MGHWVDVWSMYKALYDIYKALYDIKIIYEVPIDFYEFCIICA